MDVLYQLGTYYLSPHILEKSFFHMFLIQVVVRILYYTDITGHKITLLSYLVNPLIPLQLLFLSSLDYLSIFAAYVRLGEKR